MGDSTSPYKISKEDYKQLEKQFKTTLNNILLVTSSFPDVQNILEEFVIDVGIQVKNLLQKYHTDYKIRELEAEDNKQKLLDMRRKCVKMELQFKQIEHAINGFNKIKRS